MNEDKRPPLSRRQFTRHTALLGAALASGSSTLMTQGADSVSPETKPFLTAAEDFYTVARGNPKPHTLTGDALAAARMTPDTWRLEIQPDPSVDPPQFDRAAKVETPLTLEVGNALDLPALEELGKKHGVKYVKAMQCLNIAEPLGQGLWEGVPLRNVLRLCGKLENVRRIYFHGFHNNDPKQIFQSSVSYTQAMETAPGDLPVFLAYRLNGEPIPPVRGGPVRIIVPWAYGFKSIKWLQHIFLTNDYRNNDTYALRNNDPESFLKTAAYIRSGPEKVVAGQPAVVTGQVISGLSGFSRVETYLRRDIAKGKPRLGDDDPALLRADWKACELLPPPPWSSVLPDGVSSNDLLGFDSRTGEPLSWPTRYGMAPWIVTFTDLSPGTYELYARTVDGNGYTQPEPRPMRKAGKNMIQAHRFEVTQA